MPRVCGPIRQVAAVAQQNATTLRCETTTPFGRPVEPEVNSTYAALSGRAPVRVGRTVSGGAGSAAGSGTGTSARPESASAARPASSTTATRAPASATNSCCRRTGWASSIGT